MENGRRNIEILLPVSILTHV